MFQATDCIDGDYSSICASSDEPNAWLSVKMPPNTRVAYVVVYNRIDLPSLQYMLSPYEVFIGSAYGDVTSEGTIRCGDFTAPSTSAGPYTTNCGGQTAGRYITIRQTGTPARNLILGEIEIFGPPVNVPP